MEKMNFAKTRDPETDKSINDKITVFYNAHLNLAHMHNRDACQGCAERLHGAAY